MKRKLEATARHPAGHGPFQINILYPGEALGTGDSGVGTIGRIDHAHLMPGGLVPMHPHQDDEILTYLRQGEVVHRDRIGEETTISGTRLMMMNAGSRFHHEERVEQNGLPVEALQIFLRPHAPNLPPEIQFHTFSELHSLNNWRLVAAQESAPLRVRSRTWVYDTRLESGQTVSLPELPVGLTFLLYVFMGRTIVGGMPLSEGDALVFKNEPVIFEAVTDTDLVLFVTDEAAEYTSAGMFSGNAFRKGS